VQLRLLQPGHHTKQVLDPPERVVMQWVFSLQRLMTTSAFATGVMTLNSRQMTPSWFLTGSKEQS
jgi:hypothetical protein